MIRDTSSFKTSVTTVEGHERTNSVIGPQATQTERRPWYLTILAPLTQGGMVVVCDGIRQAGALRLTNGEVWAMSEATDNPPKVSLAR